MPLTHGTLNPSVPLLKVDRLGSIPSRCDISIQAGAETRAFLVPSRTAVCRFCTPLSDRVSRLPFNSANDSRTQLTELMVRVSQHLPLLRTVISSDLPTIRELRATCAFSGTNLPLDRKQSCCAITFDQAIVKGDVCPTSRHQLSTHDSREDSACSPLGVLRANNFCGDQCLLQPGNVDVSKSLDFLLYCVGKIIELRRHETAKADTIVFFQCPAESFRVATECFPRPR